MATVLLSVISPMRMHCVHSNIEDGLETVTVLTVVDREAVGETPREALREAYSCM